METIADAMAVEKYWDRPQYVILKKMYLDLKTMHFSYCLMEVSPGPRFLAARDFPETKEKMEKSNDLL